MVAMTAVGGRGLDIVRQLSVGWGVREDGGHVTVWATLPSAVVRPAGTDHGPTAPGTGH
jgi:hypothetical protein